ncbi:MAG: hypothetical protein GX967_05490 [Clostridiales bacterium]|nr:hypothetical protein [Clostridiales bacterium]
MTLAARLEEYIKSELSDSALYAELAKKAPSSNYRKILMEMAADDTSHANEFKRIYKSMTGRNYNPIVKPPALKGSFNEILRSRIPSESDDYRKYCEEYITSKGNSVLKTTFYLAGIDDNVHALHLIYMLMK